MFSIIRRQNWTLKTNFKRSKKGAKNLFDNISFCNHLVYAGVANPEQHGSIEDFITRWTGHFNSAPDLFELQRGLNNCFGYDLVPPVPVIRSALQAARRLNDFPTAVRVFGALKTKTENDRQFKVYLEALQEDIKELGLCTPEELNRDD